MLNETGEHIYIGVEEKDGTIGVQGPLSNEAAAKILKTTKLPANMVKAEKKGAAILKIIATSINADQSKPQPK